MMVCSRMSAQENTPNDYQSCFEGLTVFPEPLYPTIKVNGVLNCIDSWVMGLKDRMLGTGLADKNRRTELGRNDAPPDGQLVDFRFMVSATGDYHLHGKNKLTPGLRIKLAPLHRLRS